MEAVAELIEFKRPVESSKNLYVTGISSRVSQFDCLKSIKTIFSKYGLLYDILVYDKQSETPTVCHTRSNIGQYAFVKFYSTQAAKKAKSAVHLKYMFNGELLKVQFSTSKSCSKKDGGKALYIENCQKLANYYMGFNGWTSQIILLSEYCEVSTTNMAAFVCNAKITFVVHNISSNGVGLGQASYSACDASSKVAAIRTAKKMACNRAYENAFAKVSIVVLNNGKVAPVVDEVLAMATSKEMQELVEVNQIDTEEVEVREETKTIDWDNDITR